MFTTVSGASIIPGHRSFRVINHSGSDDNSGSSIIPGQTKIPGRSIIFFFKIIPCHIAFPLSLVRGIASVRAIATTGVDICSDRRRGKHLQRVNALSLCLFLFLNDFLSVSYHNAPLVAVGQSARQVVGFRLTFLLAVGNHRACEGFVANHHQGDACEGTERCGIS